MSKKEKINIVYSTDPDFRYEYDEPKEIETLSPEKQRLYVGIERNGRGGKTVTLVKGFTGRTEDSVKLAGFLKTKCGVGGNVKNGDILIQGDFRDKILQLLQSEGYNVKRSN